MEISELNLSVDEVADCLSSLDPSEVFGPDGIPALVLKECSVQIAPSLCTLCPVCIVQSFSAHWALSL